MCNNKELNDCINNEELIAYCPKLCGFCTHSEFVAENCD